MINLIPPQAKKSIVTEYWIRVASTWMYLWAFTLVCCAAIVFPAYINVSSQVTVYGDSAAQASAKVADYKTASVGLVRSSQQASTIINESRIPKFSEYFNLLESLQGSLITVSQVTILRDAEGVRPIRVVGQATDRQALASYRDRLLEEEAITEVDLPISNLAQDRNIQFTLTLVINNEIEL